MSRPQGRPRKYETLNHINIGVTDIERAKLDKVCGRLGITRHEYLTACLSCDSDGEATLEADLKERSAEVLSLKGKLDLKQGDVEMLKKKVAKLEERLKKKEIKISTKDAKMQIQIEDLQRRCKKRISACKTNVGQLLYYQGKRDEYHNEIMADLANEYRILKIKGEKDEYLEKELEKWTS
jgi:hypothetical protein